MEQLSDSVANIESRSTFRLIIDKIAILSYKDLIAAISGVFSLKNLVLNGSLVLLISSRKRKSILST